MGHKNGLDGVYFVPTRQQCFKEFIKGVTQLTIDQSEKLKTKNQILEQQNNQLTALGSDAFTILSDRIVDLEKKLESSNV